MARIAIRAVIHVISNSLVMTIRRGLVVGVTCNTRKNRVIRGVRVAIGAGCRGREVILQNQPAVD